MISIRIYNNGTFVVNNVKPEHIVDHVEYNKLFRFGCALVVNGVIENKGYLDEDRIKEIVDSIDVSKYNSYSVLPYK